MEESFMNLPPEMQERVIAQQSELIQIFSQVNPTYQTLLNKQMLDQVCLQPFTRNETTEIHEFQPIDGILYHKSIQSNVKVSYLIVIHEKLLSSEVVNMHYMNIVINNNGVYIIPIQDDLVMYYLQQFENTSSEFDLLSLHNLLANRLSCMQINPNFAKNYTLERLNIHQEEYNKFVNDIIDFEYKNKIVKTYTFLIMHKQIFNIFDKSKLSKLTNIIANIQSIKQDIGYLFEVIRKKILNL
jgi:hypothetical protein